jgi:hypothetical protein
LLRAGSRTEVATFKTLAYRSAEVLCHPKNYFRFGHFHKGSFLGVMDDLEVPLRIEIAGIVLRGPENEKELCDEAEG